MIDLKPATVRLLNEIAMQGGKPYLVGGWVRDALMGVSPKDIDVEVYGLAYTDLLRIITMTTNALPKVVGESFGIVKVDLRPWGGDDLDLSLPRRDSKHGVGHKGFEVEFASDLTLTEASARRDFTMNAISYDPFTGEVIDPFNGAGDIEHGIIKHTSPAFRDDPLRVLRLMQFVGRFGFEVDAETLMVCFDMRGEFDTLPRERIKEEFDKLFLKGKHIKKGLDVLLLTGWVVKFPALWGMVGLNQEPEWHPEGSVWQHTTHVCQMARTIATREGLSDDDTLALMYSALLHDVGKAKTTLFEDGRIRSRGHEEAGVPLAKSFMDQIQTNGDKGTDLTQQVLPLVGNHLAHLNVSNARSVRRLAKRIEPSSIEMLGWLIEADQSGRPPLPCGMPDSCRAMLDLAREAQVINEPPRPILMGRHLLALGMKPGPAMGEVIRLSYEAQLDGDITDEVSATSWAQTYLLSR